MRTGRRDYTSLITTALDDAASSTTGEGVIAARTGALELCAGQWGRALSTAAVEPAGVRSVVTSSVLALIGRELCRRGEAVFLLNLESGAMRRLDAASYRSGRSGFEPRGSCRRERVRSPHRQHADPDALDVRRGDRAARAGRLRARAGACSAASSGARSCSLNLPLRTAPELLRRAVRVGQAGVPGRGRQLGPHGPRTTWPHGPRTTKT